MPIDQWQELLGIAVNHVASEAGPDELSIGTGAALSEVAPGLDVGHDHRRGADTDQHLVVYGDRSLDPLQLENIGRSVLVLDDGLRRACVTAAPRVSLMVVRSVTLSRKLPAQGVVVSHRAPWARHCVAATTDTMSSNACGCRVRRWGGNLCLPWADRGFGCLVQPFDDEVQPELEGVAEVVAGSKDVLARELVQVGILTEVIG